SQQVHRGPETREGAARVTSASNDPDDARDPGPTARATALARRLPFTIVVVGTMLVLALATGTLWNALEDRDLVDHVAYGLPALQDGRWWTPVTSAFFALTPRSEERGVGKECRSR